MISKEKFEEIVVNVVERDISSNEDQKKAILSKPNESLFLVAGPGSGKTTVMVLKILKFIFVDDIKDMTLMDVRSTFVKVKSPVQSVNMASISLTNLTNEFTKSH